MCFQFAHYQKLMIMKDSKITAFDNFNILAFYLAPLVLLAATIAKSLDGGSNFKDGVAGGVLTCFAFMLFVFVVIQLTSFVYAQLPRFAAVMRVLMVYTCFVGFTFGLDGILLTATNESYTFWEMAGAMIFPMSGILWPISLIIMGSVLHFKKVLPPYLAGLLVLSGILFPMGRIPGNEVLCYLSDLTFIVTFFLLARHLQGLEVQTKQKASVIRTSEVV
jgi:hypothetical protein